MYVGSFGHVVPESGRYFAVVLPTRGANAGNVGHLMRGNVAGLRCRLRLLTAQGKGPDFSPHDVLGRPGLPVGDAQMRRAVLPVVIVPSLKKSFDSAQLTTRCRCC